MDRSGRTVLDIARGILGEFDLEVLLDRVVEAARELTGAHYAALGILEEPDGSGDAVGLGRFITAGMNGQTRSEIGSLPRGLGVLGELIRDPVSLRLVDVSAHPHSCGFPSGHPAMRTFLGFPLRTSGCWRRSQRAPRRLSR